MIDKDEFKAAWRKLAVRFGKEVNADQAAMYFQYLSDLMDTDEFLRACHAIWATATWFPRPADFLSVRVNTEWPLVLQAAESYRPPDGAWFEVWKELSPRAQDAVRRLGGIDAVRAQMERSVSKLRESFRSAYEEVATAEALSLPSPSAERPGRISRSAQRLARIEAHAPPSNG